MRQLIVRRLCRHGQFLNEGSRLFARSAMYERCARRVLAVLCRHDVADNVADSFGGIFITLASLLDAVQCQKIDRVHN